MMDIVGAVPAAARTAVNSRLSWRRALSDTAERRGGHGRAPMRPLVLHGRCLAVAHARSIARM